MFVLYLQKSFCKSLQISQIEYSDGASIILNFSSSKKKFLITHLSNEFCSQLLASCVFIDLFAYSFSSFIHFLNVF